MKKLSQLLLLLLLLGMTLSLQARGFRSIQPIAQPAALPPGAERITALLPIDRSLVEQAVRDVASAWNGGGLSELLADDFSSKSRLLDTIAEVVPRDARLTVLAVQAVSTLEQYRQVDKVVSTVSAMVRSQIEFNDPVVGFKRLEGTGEWYFLVTEAESTTFSIDREAVRLEVVTEHQAMVARLNERLAAMKSPPDHSEEVTPIPETEGRADASEDRLLMSPDSARSADGPFVDLIRPVSPSWVDIITISGGNFGETEGRVYVVLRDSRRQIRFSVQTWSDRAVSVSNRSIPFYQTSIEGFGLRPLRGVIWIETPDGDRAGLEVTFQTTPSIWTPEITRIMSGSSPVMDRPSITPGQNLRVIGRHFLSRPGSARFHIGDRTISAEITRWSDTALEITLPSSVEGVLGQLSRLSVSNYLGSEGEAQVDFVPRQELDEIEGTFAGDCETEPEGSRLLLNHPLLNDWRVWGRGKYRCEFVEDSLTPFSLCGVASLPEIGSTNPVAQVSWHCGYRTRSVSGYVQVMVVGPAGTSHGHASRR